MLSALVVVSMTYCTDILFMNPTACFWFKWKLIMMDF